MESPPVKVDAVFTPGRPPIFTYNPRDDRNLEGSVRRFTQTKGSALVIAGPTKSGKTVVVDRVLSRDVAVWISGSDLREIDDLWDAVIDFLGLYTDVLIQNQQTVASSSGVTGSLSAPGIASLSGQIGSNSGDVFTQARTRSRPISAVAKTALKDVDLPIVIDDFHYVHSDLQTELTRTIKSLIADVAVVLIAVPQDAFTAVRAETDMVGRVVQLAIEPWTELELTYIAERGFAALNLEDDGNSIAKEFARHSLGAPYLMQQLCLEYCLVNGIQERGADIRKVSLPDDLLGFYRAVASRIIPGVFDALRAGPKTKGQPRLPRVRKDGAVTDLYGAVLYGISKMGPVRSFTTVQLARKVADHFESPPQSQNIAFALGQMSTIARAKRQGSDAVLDFKDDTLYIGDPFLSFYLRFGDWELPKPPEDAI